VVVDLDPDELERVAYVGCGEGVNQRGAAGKHGVEGRTEIVVQEVVGQRVGLEEAKGGRRVRGRDEGCAWVLLPVLPRVEEVGSDHPCLWASAVSSN